MPSPGIVILGRVTGDVAIFDQPVWSPFAWNASSEGRAMGMRGAPKVLVRPSPMQPA